MTDWLQRIAPIPRIVGHAIADTSWIEPWRILHDHQLILFSTGEGVVDIAGDTYRCVSPYYLIIPPGERESSRALSDSWGRHWVHFDWVFQARQQDSPLYTYLPQYPARGMIRHAPDYLPQQIWHGTLSDSTHVFDLFTRLEARWHRRTTRDQLLCRALLLELLLELLAPPSVDVSMPETPDDVAYRVKHALDLLAIQHDIDTISVQAVLAACGCSYAHTERIFRQTFGLSPLRYVQMLRITRAQHLLQNTRLPIHEIARRIGIPDAFYFTRLFTRRVGCSPTAYRKECAAGESNMLT